MNPSEDDHLDHTAITKLIDPQNITPEWLSERVQRQVKSVELGEPFQSGQAEWTPLALCLDDGTAIDLLYKLYRSDNWDWGATERWFYQHCAIQMKGSLIAKCYGSGAHEEGRVVWFLFEDLNDTHQKHQSGAEDQEIRQAIPTLVGLHAGWWESEILDLDVFQGARGGNCRMANACSPANIRVQAAHFLEHELPLSQKTIGETFTDELMDLCIRVTQRWPDLLIDRIGQGRMTMIHGDAHFENMFFPRDASLQVKLTDWQSWERGIPAYDLAYMMMFDTGTEEEAMASYHEGLVAAGVTNYSWERFETDYRLSVICCLFPPMIWSRNWGGVGVLKRAIKRFEQWNCGEFLG